MSDYSPEILSRKWQSRLPTLLQETSELWAKGQPRTKPFFSFKSLEPDLPRDRQTPTSAKNHLLLHGRVVFALIARAFFPAYIPGRNTHYGSVVYSTDYRYSDSVFELGWKVNQLRQDASAPPKGTEKIARAMRDDHSSFSRLRLPPEMGIYQEAYLANLCIHRTRLPAGYLHDRLLPILIAPKYTEWCCILPLRFWSAELVAFWLSGHPANDPAQFSFLLSKHGIRP